MNRNEFMTLRDKQLRLVGDLQDALLATSPVGNADVASKLTYALNQNMNTLTDIETHGYES